LKTESSRPDLENAISLLLRYVVLLSSLVIAVGIALTLLGLGPHADYATLDQILKTNVGRPVLDPGQFIVGLYQGSPLGVLQLGIIILLAIPFFRVLASALMFASERDWAYVAVAAFVFAVLLFGAFVIGPLESSR